ncbi:radical SAM protein [Pseudothauera nasutitermitis]|nr:radical SAM protein [Pseudothauera nasutitermitis]
MKLTKNCMAPWRAVEFLADGKISPCCGPIRGDFGNLQQDLPTLGAERGLFRNADYRKLRNALLTGDLPDACKQCRAVHEPDIPAEALAAKVAAYLEARGVPTAGEDLAGLYAFDECGGNITNRCNFSCIYCSHSGPDGHRGTLAQVMDQDFFMAVLDELVARGLQIFNFCGLGELTTYRHWQRLCQEIFARHPRLRLRLITNFGRKLDADELRLLTRFEIVQISCDTFDEERFAWLRTHGKLPVLRQNLENLLAATREHGRSPRIVFNVTVSNANVDDMVEVFRYAAGNDIHIHLSALFDMEGSITQGKAILGKIWEVSDAALLHNREVFIDLPRRALAANPSITCWEYRHLHDQIMSRADRITFDQFVPAEQEIFYSAFFSARLSNQQTYLRKIWLGFDDSIRGIWIAPGNRFVIPLPAPSARLSYRCHTVRTRVDGTLILAQGESRSAHVGKLLTVSAPRGGDVDHFLEITGYTPEESLPPLDEIVLENGASVPAGYHAVRESADSSGVERIAAHFAASQEPLIIWCAGLKTLQALSDTRLAEANISMIVDSDAHKHGQSICGHVVQSTERVLECDHPILILHASEPRRIEQQIRTMGIENELLIP